MKKAFALLAALLIVLLPCLTVNAYPSSGSITVVMINKANKKPVENADVTVVKVADCSYTESDITFSLNYDFYDTGVDLNSTDAPETLYASAKEKGVSGLNVKSDSDGMIIIASCDLGVYLIYSQDEIFSPFLVFVPMVTDDGISFDITAEPKIDISEETVPDPVIDTNTTEPATTSDDTKVTQPSKPSGGEKLPQTGMLQYPVPLLGLCGVLMFSKGFIMYANGKKEEN
ncbi:MAG: hypothetical protein E7515_02580 [Ruminococcaceae bacterium]|nr:hypothetical protein [Oscillospiraceae bacterium]